MPVISGALPTVSSLYVYSKCLLNLGQRCLKILRYLTQVFLHLTESVQRIQVSNTRSKCKAVYESLDRTNIPT